MSLISRSQVEIVPAVPGDASALRQLAIDAGIDAWSESGYLEEITSANAIVLKAVGEEQIVGFLVARVVPGSNELDESEIYNIAVAEASRREQTGTKLLEALWLILRMRRVEKVWLEVRASNIPAIRFYESQGLAAQITRPNFYRDPVENAVVMSLDLRPPDEVSEL